MISTSDPRVVVPEFLVKPCLCSAWRVHGPGVQEELPWGDLSHLDWEHRYFQAGLAFRDFSGANQEKGKEKVSNLGCETHRILQVPDPPFLSLSPIKWLPQNRHK